MELKGLIQWAEIMVHYMQIAIGMGKPSLAEIAIDAKDLEYMTAILDFLKKGGITNGNFNRDGKRYPEFHE